MNESESKTTTTPTVLITGSSGLIGSRLQERLAGDFHVVGMDRVPPDKSPPDAEFVECDLTDDGSVQAGMERIRERYGSQLASVIHLAAYYDFSYANSDLHEELTIGGTKRLLRELRDFTVEQLIFASSLLVMKPADETDESLREGMPLEAKWAYPESKIEVEELLRRERGDIPVVILRLAGVYDRRGHLPPVCQHMKMILEKQLEAYVFPGNADHGQSFVHLADAVSCFERAVAARGRLDPLEVFLVGEPEVLSYAERQQQLGQLIHGTDWPLFHVPKSLARAGAWVKDEWPGTDPFIKSWMIDLADDHYPVEIEKARAKLGWEPEHRLRDELPRMVEALRENPQEWYEENGMEVPDELKVAPSRG